MQQFKKGILPENQYSNTVTIRSPLGHAKSITYSIPSQNHSYGSHSLKKKQPTSHIIYGWDKGTFSQQKITKLNYIAINKSAIRCISQNKNIRLAHVGQVQGSNHYAINLPQQQFCYGKKRQRNFDSIKQIIQNEQMNIHERKMNKIYDKMKDKRINTLQSERYYLNGMVRQEDNKKLWKIRKFNKIQNKVKTLGSKLKNFDF